MPQLTSREPHLRRFRVHADSAGNRLDVQPDEGVEPVAGDPAAEQDTGPRRVALMRPGPPPERPSLADRFDRWRDDPRARLAAVVIAALLAGLYWYRSALAEAPPPLDAGEAQESADGPPPTTGPEATGDEVVVHVSGAVARPGLLRLDPGARVADAIDAAGGPLASADLDQLNLAAPLGDGERVHVPVEGEEPLAGAAGGPAAPGPLNVNTASVAELEALPGIGPAIAEAIVAERAARRFETIDDLLRVRGIGPSRLEELRSLVTV